MRDVLGPIEREPRGPIGDTLKFSLGPYTFKRRATLGLWRVRIPRRRHESATRQLGAIAECFHTRQSARGDLPTSATGNGSRRSSPDHRVAKSIDPLCFVHTWFEDGDYCVPDTATTTKRIFSLLAQLIAIQTAASDLSITPVVRIIQ